VQIKFTRTWDRIVGGIISIVTTLFLGGFVLLAQLKLTAPQKNSAT
jgi:hypothetical protein